MIALPPYTPMPANPGYPYSQTNIQRALLEANQVGQTLSQKIDYQQNLAPYSPWQHQGQYNVLMWSAMQRLWEELQHIQAYLVNSTQTSRHLATYPPTPTQPIGYLA